MISEETVSHVAKLSRLALTPEETQRYTKELSKILEMVDQLSELDLSKEGLDVKPEHPTLFRPDEKRGDYSRDELLVNAPQEEDGFFRVPRILEEES
jgi:aspartyl-tRNA(Asn)/glutamyl-tRNA(Gln) amidotransferase subunit C